jgi:hypothetical protein
MGCIHPLPPHAMHVHPLRPVGRTRIVWTSGASVHSNFQRPAALSFPTGGTASLVILSRQPRQPRLALPGRVLDRIEKPLASLPACTSCTYADMQSFYSQSGAPVELLDDLLSSLTTNAPGPHIRATGCLVRRRPLSKLRSGGLLGTVCDMRSGSHRVASGA